MLRPCFLVIDREFAGSISTRKLVIETAKFNVITAYSGQEAIDTLKKFPAVDGIVLDAAVRDLPASDLVQEFKRLQPQLPVIVVCSPGAANCDVGDHQLESYDPSRLIVLLQSILPQQAAEVLQHEVELTSAIGGGANVADLTAAYHSRIASAAQH